MTSNKLENLLDLVGWFSWKYLLLFIAVNCWLNVSTKCRLSSGQYVTQK